MSLKIDVHQHLWSEQQPFFLAVGFFETHRDWLGLGALRPLLDTAGQSPGRARHTQGHGGIQRKCALARAGGGYPSVAQSFDGQTRREPSAYRAPAGGRLEVEELNRSWGVGS